MKTHTPTILVKSNVLGTCQKCITQSDFLSMFIASNEVSSSYSTQNKLKLNISKAKVSMPHPCHKFTLYLLMAHQLFEYIQSSKALGIYFSADMSWDTDFLFVAKQLHSTPVYWTSSMEHFLLFIVLWCSCLGDNIVIAKVNC